MKLGTYKIFRILSKISLLVIGVSLVGYLGYITYQSISFAPKKVRITNITESSATISWVTDTPTKGVVYYKQEDSFLPGPLGFVGAKKAYDDRDYYGSQLERVNDVNEKNLKNKDAEYVVDPENIDYEDFKVTKLGDYYTHHVTIRGLDPVSKYYFVVSDNWFSWDIDGVDQSRELTEVYGAVEFNFTTFDRLNSVPSPNPAYGKVVGVYRDENGMVHDNLNQDTVVYGFLFDEESLDQTSMYSSVTNEEGGWVIDKASMRSEDGSLPYNFKSGEDSIVLYPQYMNLEESFSVVLILGEEDSPASDLVGGQEVEITESNEISVLNNMLGLISTKVSAIALIDGVIGIAGSSSSLEAGRGRVVFVPTVAGSSGMSTDELENIQTAIRELNKTGADPVDVVTNVYEYAEAGKDQGKKDEIIQRVTKKVWENNDDRYKQVPCTGTKSDWGINCYIDDGDPRTDDKLLLCPQGAVAAGCGTNAACYKSGQGEYGYANKCVGCTRPASCANVWARPSDVVVDGQLYTKNDILKVALGDIDNVFLQNLSKSLDGKKLCTNAAGDKWEVVKNTSSCPKYWNSIQALENLDIANLKSDSSKCKAAMSVLTAGSKFDVDEYCSTKIGSGEDRTCLIGDPSCGLGGTQSCDITCPPGLEKKISPSTGIFSSSVCICTKDDSFEDFLGPDPVLVEKKLREITVRAFPANTDVWGVKRELEEIGGVIIGTKENGTVKIVSVLMDDEEYEDYLSKKKDSASYIFKYVTEEKEVSDQSRYFLDGTEAVSFEKTGGIDNKTYLYSREMLMDISERAQISLTVLERQIRNGNMKGFVLLEKENGIVVLQKEEAYWDAVVVGRDILVTKLTNSQEHVATVRNTSITSQNPIILTPEEKGEYKLQEFIICDAQDSEFCGSIFAVDLDAVQEEFKLTEDTKSEVASLTEVKGSSMEVITCPKPGDCVAAYTYEIMQGGKKVTKTLENVKYVDGQNVILIKDKNGKKITTLTLQDSSSVEILEEGEKKEVDLEGTGLELYEDQLVSDLSSDLILPVNTRNGSWISMLQMKALSIFSPTKVQAQQLDKYVDGSNDKGLYEIITSSGKTVHYVDTTSSPYIVFYEEGNNEPGFQEPLDINNPQEGEDILVFVNKDSVKKISQAYQYWIEEGINMMSFPFLPVNQEKKAMMASDLMISNNTVVEKISQITYFENGKWAGGIKASGDNKYVGYDFPLVPGRGYLIVGEYGTNISIPGFPLSEPFPVELSAGWNFVGVHGYQDIYTAEKLIDELDKLEGIDVDNVTWWPRNLGRYEGLQKTGSTKYGFDYPLSDRLAYFVRVSSYSNKCPRSVLWNPGGEAHGICGSN